MPSISTLELSGWKAIAVYLRVSIRTAQSMERTQGLPIRRGSGTKGPVFAIVAELEQWKLQQSLAPRSLGLGRADDPATEAAQSTRAVSGSAIRRLVLYGIPVLAVLALIAYWVILHPVPVSDFLVQGRNLIAIDSKGRELWRHTFPWELRATDYVGDGRIQHSWLGRLSANEKPQLLFTVRPYNDLTFGNPVLCFNSEGAVRWRFEAGREVEDGGGDHMGPPYLSSHLQVIYGRTRAETRIIVSSNHYLGQANQVAFLDTDGRVVAEYWHPGHVLHLEQADLDGSGRNKLLLAGVNNGNHKATLVVLDPLKVSGVITPKEMDDHRFALLNMAPAHERAGVFFPRSCISAGQPYTRVKNVEINKARIVVAVSEGISEREEGFVYEFDYNLQVVNVEPTNGVEVERIHRELEAQGKLDHTFNVEKECARLKAGVIVRRGD